MSDGDADMIRAFLKGHTVPAPFWILILEAAGFDPMRAQDMEERLTATWWERYMVYRKQMSIIQRSQEHKRKNG